MAARNIMKQKRTYGFATSTMRACLGNLPVTPPKEPFQKRVISLLDEFDGQEWYNNPVTTVINGEKITTGTTATTVDAFNVENGKIIHADRPVLDALKKHAHNIDTSVVDYREAARKIEDTFLAVEDASHLIANQAMDFKKQDGFTEIEEWTQACVVERRMNDALLKDEAAGKVVVNRAPAFIGCVSNFSNFLDLSKKILRHLEVGVPVIVLSRNNTTQHMYRWFLRLSELMAEHGIPKEMATYASLDVAGQRELLSHCPESAMHFTGSREVAALLKEVAPKLMAATVGPNTMVVSELNDKTREAVRISSTIENAGQCTHVRHLVAPGATLDECEKIYDTAHMMESPLESIKAGFRCDGFLKGAPTTAGVDKTYTAHPRVPAAYRVNNHFPEDTIDEKWRQGFIDVTRVENKEQLKDPKFLDGLAAWLVRNGPITLCVNGDDDVAQYLFERTSMTVYTLGTLEAPGLNVSARPQEMEAFGEFPARPTLSKYTKFPVLVPSAVAAMNTEYAEDYLKKAGEAAFPAEFAQLNVLRDAASASTRGYLRTIFDFLNDACGAHNNTGIDHVRTAVAGWQRPPLSGTASVLRVSDTTSIDALATYLLPYLCTNAKECVHVSVDPANTAAVELVQKLDITSKVESTADYEATTWELPPYNVQFPTYDGKPTEGGAPMVSSLLLLLFPVGHIKCLIPNNQAFVDRWSKSKKWLSVSA